jgi:hypothetical protein
MQGRDLQKAGVVRLELRIKRAARFDHQDDAPNGGRKRRASPRERDSPRNARHSLKIIDEALIGYWNTRYADRRLALRRSLEMKRWSRAGSGRSRRGCAPPEQERARSCRSLQ